jgi:hypothetical protein
MKQVPYEDPQIWDTIIKNLVIMATWCLVLCTPAVQEHPHSPTLTWLTLLLHIHRSSFCIFIWKSLFSKFTWFSSVLTGKHQVSTSELMTTPFSCIVQCIIYNHCTIRHLLWPINLRKRCYISQTQPTKSQFFRVWRTLNAEFCLHLTLPKAT